MEDRISSFEDLRVWQESQILAVMAYRLVKQLPKDEVFGLISQMKRAVASVSANIAEGFGRKTNKDKLQFYRIAYGSLLETKNFLYLSEKLRYISNTQLEEILEQVVICQKLLNAFMRPLK